jgi:hypothetical protein
MLNNIGSVGRVPAFKGETFVHLENVKDPRVRQKIINAATGRPVAVPVIVI